MADNEHPPRRDLEPRATPPVDPEQYRQFEQFQQFQQFLAFKEAQGEGGTGTMPPQLPPGRGRPMWKKILFSKAVRKLAYLLVVILLLVWAYNYFFPGPQDDGLGTQGSAGPGQESDTGKGSGTPGAAVESLYEYTSHASKTGFNQQQDFATLACTLFTKEAKASFTRDLGGSDCPNLLRGLETKVGPLQSTPLVDITGKNNVQLSSCHDLYLKPGTQGLGLFIVTKRGDGWVISGHEPEPNPCPAPSASGSSTPTPTVPTTTSR
ncbi:hypothetical protein [Actinocrispum sp. NPDC049592]|uniref:hypothetical protein n=1 Tax=Actinocrispum sp. NPDC049592 TaxID=3154835 RepID=UPI00342D3FEF